MDNFIDQIEISNFKSIRDLKLQGFKRINLFIGRPNVGKSNLLEALSLFSLPYVWEGSKKLTNIIRLKAQRELFYNGNFSIPSKLKLVKFNNEGNFILKMSHIIYRRETNALLINIFDYPINESSTEENTDWFNYYVDEKFKLSYLSSTRKQTKRGFLKAYRFNDQPRNKIVRYSFLQPPFGSNLLDVLELMPELRQLYAQWFRQYGLHLVLDTASQSVKIQKDKGDNEVFQLPYSSVADTLQRIIFYKTAVASNQNSVLLFEEPEAHAFPPYITEFTQEVIRSLTNQFFIVTHSPLIVEEFLTDAIDDLSIFMVDFKDGQTVVRGLTTDEIYEVRKYGVDLFFNNEAYLS